MAGFVATFVSSSVALLPTTSSSASPPLSLRRNATSSHHVQGLRYQQHRHQRHAFLFYPHCRSRNSLPLWSCYNSKTSAATAARAVATARTAEEDGPTAAAATSVRDIRTTGPHGDDHSSRCMWRTGVAAMLAAATISTGLNASAELNKFEAETRGEFGVGSAAQYGSADLRKTVHANENFRRANFTSADMREADFSGCPFNGAYMEKAVAYKTNFSGADLSDTLMDRMVLNEANFTDALLVRAVLTRSDLGKAVIDGADFSDAVLDLQQKLALCKYASGTNPVTGMDTRRSLGCGNSRRNAYGTPSAPELSAPPEKLLNRDGFCDDVTGLCKGTGLQ